MFLFKEKLFGRFLRREKILKFSFTFAAVGRGLLCSQFCDAPRCETHTRVSVFHSLTRDFSDRPSHACPRSLGRPVEYGTRVSTNRLLSLRIAISLMRVQSTKAQKIREREFFAHCHRDAGPRISYLTSPKARTPKVKWHAWKTLQSPPEIHQSLAWRVSRFLLPDNYQFWRDSKFFLVGVLFLSPVN